MNIGDKSLLWFLFKNYVENNLLVNDFEQNGDDLNLLVMTIYIFEKEILKLNKIILYTFYAAETIFKVR